jgi:hypothetical protein
MGRPIGSMNRQKPFNDALLMTLRSNPLALRRISAKWVEKAEEGDLAAIREIADRLTALGSLRNMLPPDHRMREKISIWGPVFLCRTAKVILLLIYR